MVLNDQKIARRENVGKQNNGTGLLFGLRVKLIF